MSWNLLHAQPVFEYHFSNPDFELRGILAVEGAAGSIYVLGQKNFYDPTSGNPIEGTLTLGSHILKLNAAGELIWEQTFENSFTSIALEAFGRQPAHQLLVLPDESLLLPYHKFMGILECEMPGLGRFSQKAGMMRIAPTATLIWDRLLDDLFCGDSRPLLAFPTAADSLSVLLRDDGRLRLLRADTNGNLRQVFDRSYSFTIGGAYKYQENFLVWGNQNSTFRFAEISPAGDSLRTLLLPEAMREVVEVKRPKTLPDKGLMLLLWYWDPHMQRIRSGLLRTDSALQVSWYKTLNRDAIDVEVLAGGSLLLLRGNVVHRYG
ncbi:MAG: hypothetical protein D6730_10745, partial [Bacteroidetes bacterium]